MSHINPAEILTQICQTLPNWRLEDNAKVISRDFKFQNFKQAFAFMTEVAAEADRLDHHPEWSNIYNNVTIRLTTHDAGGLTQLDVALAYFIDTVFTAT